MAIFQSLFDVIGPVMVGPSSSHTAGAVRIGLAARSIFGKTPSSVTITFYGSFAHTYRGHGTDLALIAGLLGFSTASTKIRDAYQWAEREHMAIDIVCSDERTEHPNTATVSMTDGDETMSVTGVSLGGGMIDLIEIDGFSVRVHSDNPVFLIFHRDRPGLIASVTQLLAVSHVNVSQMDVSRKARGELALMVIATDTEIPEATMSIIEQIEDVSSVIALTDIQRDPDEIA
ncbi:MAG: L-serine ammonia-lyase, iron-sulfur-dependent subunit beta [Saccharofermentanales bacterium]|jgi:L-serine dehydratase